MAGNPSRTVGEVFVFIWTKCRDGQPPLSGFTGPHLGENGRLQPMFALKWRL